MSETKDQIAAERDQLRAENENLRGQLSAAGAGRAYQPAAQFILSEGNRQELLQHGVTTIGGRRATREQVAEATRGNPTYANVDLGDRDPDPQPAGRPVAGVPGVDFVYPSVAPGLIDPDVAGLPGISGPPATEADLAPPAADPVVPLEHVDDQE